MTFCLASVSNWERSNYLSSIVAVLCGSWSSKILGPPAVVCCVLLLAVTTIFPFRISVVWVSVHHIANYFFWSRESLTENQCNPMQTDFRHRGSTLHSLEARTPTHNVFAITHFRLHLAVEKSIINHDFCLGKVVLGGGIVLAGLMEMPLTQEKL